MKPNDETTAGARPKPVKAGKFVLLALAAAAAVAFVGISERKRQAEDLGKWTRERAVPTVEIIRAKATRADREVVLPGDVEAFLDASIYGQIGGYIHNWSVDIGATVQKGDILAVIDTPELDERIAGARGEVDKAKAAMALAKVTADRWAQLRASAAVSQQAADEKAGDLDSHTAELAAAQSNLDRLKALKGFSNIVAPFDGIVTARNVDVGTLVSANGSSAVPLFKVADMSKVRVFVRAPESYAADLKPGVSATFELPEYPDRKYVAKITTTSRSIDRKSRTLLVELVVDNPGGELSSGAFARVHFDILTESKALTVPAEALLFREDGIWIATLDAQGRVHEKSVKIARDFGSEVELASGVAAEDRIIANPSDYLAEGDEVRVAGDGAPGAKSAGQAAPPSGARAIGAAAAQERASQ